MNELRDPLIRQALALLGAAAITLGCESHAEPPAVGVARAALVDGGASPGREYSVFVSREIAGGPAPRSDASLAFDAKAGVSVLIGGVGNAVNGFSDTWTYDGAWTKRCDFASCATQPSGRHLSSLAFAPERGVTALFGGVNAGNDFLCDTWEWDTEKGTWTPRAEAPCDSTVPRARAGHAMAGYGAKIALFGGLVLPGGASTAQRSNELLVWDGQSWARLCDDACVARSTALPAPRAFASLVHARLDRGDVLLVFGGNVQTTAGAAPANDVWEYDVASSRWTELCASATCKSSRPGPRIRHGAAYDSIRGRLVVHGGCNASCAELVPDAWEFDPAADRWAPIPPPMSPGLPDGKASFGMVFDSKKRRIVEFGGYAITSMVGNTVELFTRGAACTNEAECHTGVCSSGVCAEPCTASGTTGPCVNGFACNDACGAKCQSCARVPGVCTAVTSGADDEPGPPSAQCTNGSVCIPGASASAGECKFAAGQACNLPAECASGFCSSLAPHVCVDATCNKPCQMPQGAACAPRERLAEPPDLGCAGLRCGNDGACLERCTTDEECAPDHRCDTSDGKCRALKGPGAPCASATECKLPYCVDGVCCGSSCDGPCDQCGANGECSQRTGGVQPLKGHSACLGSGTCGGYCGGRTACIQPGADTSCAPARCFDRDYVLEPSVCNGNGACVDRTTPQDCRAYACDGAKGECFRECDENSQCRRGAICRPGPDGRGVCHDEDTECVDEYSIRTQTGSIQGCDGYRCRNNFCAFGVCSPDVPGDCAPGYVCRARACVELRGEDGDAGGRRSDGGSSKGVVAADGGDPAPGDSSSCAFVRPRTEASRRAYVLLSLALSVASAFFVRRRHGTRVKGREVPDGAPSHP